MKSILSALVFVFLASLPEAAFAEPNISGTWNVSGLIAPGVGRNGDTWAPACVFQQSGTQLAATCKGPAAVGPAAGVVSGSAVTFEWNYTRDGPIFSGVIGADGVIRGSVTFEGRTGTFTATRAQ
jgi:hypothetical protein